MSANTLALPSPLNAALLLADGTVFWGYGIGAPGTVLGEICFNTAMTGYQEVLTDPSYMGQIITFTFPHIGNVGCNREDVESGEQDSGFRIQDSDRKNLPESRIPNPDPLGACGLVIRESITNPSSWRATSHLGDWLEKRGLTGICGVDTRALTRHIRLKGAQNGAIVFRDQDLGFRIQVEQAREKLTAYPSLKGLELAEGASTKAFYEWTVPRWALESEIRNQDSGSVSSSLNPESLILTPHVVAVDYGEKLNILRCLASLGCKVTVVPAKTSAKDILALKPNGIFLSNGPGDPAATGIYALPIIRELMETGIPIFGICLGHQLLGLACGGKTEKMKQGHRGANHPVQDLQTGKVEITSQNHGFVVSDKDLPAEIEVTHRSLFDGTIQGLRHKTKPVFCVQGHPEASPGPHDSLYLFKQFVDMMENRIQDSGFGIQEKKTL